MENTFNLDAEISKLNTPQRYNATRHRYEYSESDIQNLFNKANTPICEEDYLYKKGDMVKVYSLQSFNDGGFLNGVEGYVSQNQRPKGSVLVSVIRSFNGVKKIDMSYEVYPEQLRLVKDCLLYTSDAADE